MLLAHLKQHAEYFALDGTNVVEVGGGHGEHCATHHVELGERVGLATLPLESRALGSADVLEHHLRRGRAGQGNRQGQDSDGEG